MLYALKHATTTTARVWARWPAGGTLSIMCSGSAFGAVALTSATDYSGVVEVSGLSPGSAYPFDVLIDGTARDSGTLRTMPETGADFVIGFGSCFTHYRAAAAIYALRERFGGMLSAFCFQGDFPYVTASAGFTGTISGFGESFKDVELCGDITSESVVKANLYAHHRYWWQIPGASEVLREVPCYFISDDHERPGDNWDRTLTQANAYHPGTFSTQQQVDDVDQWCRDVLNVYYAGNPENDDANRDMAYPPAQQLYYDRVIGDAHLISLETIEYASGAARYGATQVAWLKSRLLASGSPFKIINSGKGPTEYGAALSAEQADIYNYITANGITGVVWMCGDIHCVGVRADAVMCVRGGPASNDGHTDVPNGYAGATAWKEWGYQSMGAPGGAVGAVGFVHVRPSANRITVGVIDSRGSVRWSADIPAGTNTPAPSAQRFA